MNRTTIDKVKIRNTDFVLNQLDTFGINSHNKQPNEPIRNDACCYDSKGNPIIAQNIYIHSTTIPYHVNIKTNNGIPTTWIEFNPNHFKGSLEHSILQIEKDLKETHRFEFNFLDSLLSRTDIARDSEMIHVAKGYHEPKKHLAKSRYTKDKTEFPDSLLYKTSGFQLCDYDKGKKNQIDKGIKNPISTNNLRAELRLMKPEYIKKHLGFNDLNTLLDVNETELQKIFVETQKKFLNDLNHIAKKSPMQPDVINVMDLMPVLMNIHSTKERITTYLGVQRSGTFDVVTLRHNYIQAIELYIETISFPSRQAKSNFKARELKALDSKLREWSSLIVKINQQKEHSLNDRINEYQDKILSA